MRKKKIKKTKLKKNVKKKVLKLKFLWKIFINFCCTESKEEIKKTICCVTLILWSLILTNDHRFNLNKFAGVSIKL